MMIMKSSIKNLVLKEIIKQRFGIHRGLETHAEPNSLKAIQYAVALKPVFVEFDVTYADDVIKTGHPPQEPLDKLEDVLSVFEESKTYPKIDIKLKNYEQYSIVIDNVLKLVSQTDIDFVLINVSGLNDRDCVMEVENYLSVKIRNNPKIRLNIDLAKYKGIDDCVKKHVNKLGDVIYSVSPEIHEENWDKTIRFAEKNNIENCYFWLRGSPDTTNPDVTEETIQKALSLEEKYNVKIYFDISPPYIKGFQ